MALISCPECGKQISTKAISCPNCGWVVEKSEKIITKTSSELDRNALLLYLSRIRELETIKQHNNEKIYQANELYNRYVNFVPLNQPRQFNAIKPQQPTKPVIYKFFVGLFVIMLISNIAAMMLMLSEPEHISLLPIIILCTLSLGGMAVFVRKQENNRYLSEIKAYNEEIAQYETAMKSYDTECQKVNIYNQKMLEDKQTKPALIQNDINEINVYNNRVQTHLEKMYSQNIIPKQMRDIYGAYYLYDYLSTSNQSLSEALIQYNLETIKQQLMEMIQLNKQMVIQQAITNSKLDDIQIGNSEMLSTLQRLETNSELSLKYSQINAENSAIAADLANESLAYNKAAFWMDEYERLTR